MYNRITDETIDVTALVRPDGERFVLLYTHRTRAEALRTLGRWASNPELGFTWYDAAVLSGKISNQQTDTPKGTQ